MPKSARLTYRPLAPDDLEVFHALVVDEHVREYLLDGEVMTEPWCRDEIATSQAALAASGWGLWLVELDAQVIGFCGFRVFEGLGDAPQLLYALLQAHTGNGYATEMGSALVEHAKTLGWAEVVSAVDAPNAASVRVLEKIGFEITQEIETGAFGTTLLFVRRL